MKILLLTSHLNAGGITQYLLTLTKGLLTQGHEVHIVASTGDRENDFKNLGAQIIRLPFKTKSELDVRLYTSLGALKKCILDHKIDVIHAHTRVTQVMAYFLGRSTDLPVLTTCHGYFKTRFFRRIFPCWGDAVIAISPAVVAHLRDDWKLSTDRIALVSSGIDLSEFPLIKEEDKKKNRAKLGLKDEFVVGMVARLSDVKGQDILVQAMKDIIAAVPQTKLFLAGQGKLEGLLKEMVKSSNLSGHVLFYPSVNETYENLSVIDVFVAPSRQEGLGLSIMEAQAVGLPVVASNVGGIPSLIQEGQTGLLVPPENPSALAKAIICLLKDPALAKEIGLAARKRAERNYSADKMIKKTIEIYEENINC